MAAIHHGPALHEAVVAVLAASALIVGLVRRVRSRKRVTRQSAHDQRRGGGA